MKRVSHAFRRLRACHGSHPGRTTCTRDGRAPHPVRRTVVLRRLHRVAVLTALLAGLVGPPSQTASSTAQAAGWQQDFEQAWQQAQRLQRPLLVHFYADWCGPCRQMDYAVLNTPEVLRTLDADFVAVKVNVDQRRDLANRFGVQSIPTDLFILPDGQVVSRSTGEQSKEAYLAQLARVLSRHQQARRLHVAAKAAPSSNTRPHNGSSPAAEAAGRGTTSNQRRPTAFVGLEGYSPVALKRYRKWVKGSPQFAAQYQGVTFYMANAEELAEFRRAPDLYAPRLLGCDPVILYLTDRAIPGSIEYGAFFDGQLYLFASDKTRQLFKENPLRYVQVRNVLNVDEVIRLSRR